MDPQLVSLAIGTLLPLLVAVVVRSYWPGWAKGLIVVVSSVGAGLAVSWAAGELAGRTVLGSVIAVFFGAVASYKLFWQPTGIGPALEKATTPATPEDA